MKIGCVLDVFDTEENDYIVLEATRDEIAEKFNITKVSISGYLKHGYKIRKRYELLRSDEEEPQYIIESKFTLEQLTEWDKVRLQINPRARRY